MKRESAPETKRAAAMVLIAIGAIWLGFGFVSLLIMDDWLAPGLSFMGIGLIAIIWSVFIIRKNPVPAKAASPKPPSTILSGKHEQDRAAIRQVCKKVSKKARALRTLMTGQLVARFYQDQDPEYKLEYTRRLEHVGIRTNVALRLFDYELSLMTPKKASLLVDNDYLQSFYFDLDHPLLTESKDNYVSRQCFLCSEITKIWDEAEWHYWNSHESPLPDDVWAEIYTLSRYGGGELFVEYLEEMAKRAQVEISDLSKYSRAEQDMIFYFKWEGNGSKPHPYM